VARPGGECGGAGPGPAAAEPRNLRVVPKAARVTLRLHRIRHKHFEGYEKREFVLRGAVWADSYATLASVGYLDGLDKKRGRQNVNFTVIEYGVQFERPNLEVAVRQRVIGTTQLQDLGSHLAGGYEVRMTDSNGNGTGGSGTCFGDSGGPVFHTADNGVQYLVGDISWGTKYCKGTSAAFRLDAPDAHAFVTSFVH
jgi:hypothetical protein